jgi:hypothetical protein
MKTTHVLRYAAIGMATLGLGMGMAAASSVSLDKTGPDSHNSVKLTAKNTSSVKNHNNVGVANITGQDAGSGNAKVKDNTTGGDATSGDVSNDNAADTSVSVDNSAGAMGLGSFFGGGDHDVTMSETGPDSRNNVEIKTTNSSKVTNTNNVGVVNLTNQSAWSGNASVKHNTTGGDATTGSASNTNSSTTTVDLSN